MGAVRAPAAEFSCVRVCKGAAHVGEKSRDCCGDIILHVLDALCPRAAEVCWGVCDVGRGGQPLEGHRE